MNPNASPTILGQVIDIH